MTLSSDRAGRPRLESAWGRKQGIRCRPWLVLAFFLLAVLLSCSTKRIEIPTYEGVDPRYELARRDTVGSIRSTFSIQFEKDGGTVKGDAALSLTPDSLELRVYSLGFLVAEVIANDTVTKSDPPLDRSRIELLTEGLRNSFFWWSIKDFEIREEGKVYRLWNSWRRLIINKRTLLPERQTIELEDGRELDISYGEPENMGGTWFPSRMRIVLSRYTANVTIKTLTVIPQ